MQGLLPRVTIPALAAVDDVGGTRTLAVGGSLGYQLFYDGTRQQVIFEIGGRQDTNNPF